MSEAFLKNPLSLFEVKGKTAIITGASGAFGALAAKTLAGAGANVVLAGSKQDELKKVAAECEALGGKTEIVALRPNSEENCDKIVKAAVDKFGRLDILVVASGLNKVAKIVDQKPEDFLDVMDANVTQSWLMARAAGKQMIKQGGGGKVILTSSARGLLGHPAGYTAYCASKSAVDGITKALGCEWGDSGITVNALGPTVFRSPLTAWMYEDTERAKACATASSRACRRAAWASRRIWRGRCCSLPRKRRTSTPATFFMPTAAIRRGEPMRWRQQQTCHSGTARRAGPEIDTPQHRGYGFRARRFAAPRNDGV